MCKYMIYGITLVSRIVQYSNVTCRKHIWIPYYKKLSFTEKLKSLLALASLQTRCPWLALCRILFVRQADLHRDKPLEFFTENQHVTAEWQISLINLLKWEVVIDCERLRLVAIMYMISIDVKRLEAALAIMMTTSAAVLKLRAWVHTLVWQGKLAASPTWKMEEKNN